MVPIEQVVTVFALITLIPVVIVVVQGIRYNSSVKDLTNEIEWLNESKRALQEGRYTLLAFIEAQDKLIEDLNSALEKANDEPPTHVRVQVSDSDLWHVFTDLYVAFVFVHASQTTYPDLSFKVEAVKGIKVAGIEL